MRPALTRDQGGGSHPRKKLSSFEASLYCSWLFASCLAFDPEFVVDEFITVNAGLMMHPTKAISGTVHYFDQCCNAYTTYCTTVAFVESFGKNRNMIPNLEAKL